MYSTSSSYVIAGQERRASEYMTYAPLRSLNSVGGVATEMNGINFLQSGRTIWQLCLVSKLQLAVNECFSFVMAWKLIALPGYSVKNPGPLVG